MRRVVSFVVVLTLTAFAFPALAQPGIDYVPARDEPAATPPPQPERSYPHWRRSYNPDGLELVAIAPFGSGLVTWADDFEIAEPGDDDLPDALGDSGLRLHEVAWGAGGGARFYYQSTNGVRFGTGLAVHRLMGHTLGHDALVSGVSLRLDDVNLIGAEITLGKAFDAGDVLPYVDLMARFNVLITRLEVSVAPVGTAGTVELRTFDFTLAPRIGLWIPLNEDIFIDVAAHGGIFGLERGGATLTLGYFDML